MTIADADSDRGGVQVISRAAAILRCLEGEPAGLSLGEIAKRCALPRSTVQRLVDALTLEELLEIHGRGGVCLGPALMRLASHSHVDIVQKARPYLESLGAQTGETIVLASAAGAELLILHTVVSSLALRVSSGPGGFLNIYGIGGGKALLARMDNESVIKLIGRKIKPLTPNTLTLPGLLEQLDEIRRTGIAFGNEEHTEGVASVAVSLQTPQGVYSIDVAGPSWRIAKARDRIEEALLKCREDMMSGLRCVE
jgi:DNA-binding IclR family transcriptional regulator